MIFLALLFSLLSANADPLEILRNLDLEAAPHNYYERPTNDRFAKLRGEIDSGRVTLNRSSEKAFLLSLLKALEIPESSQMLVLSTTSLQLSLISPSNPRALYFNDDTYLGFVPGGRIEIVSIDPKLGGMFYIFDVPKNEGPLAIERSRRCMNCHAGSEAGYVPGVVIKSVIPGRRGGSLDAFRVDLTGHGIPLEERFGGWYLTGIAGFTNHWANAIGRPGSGGAIAKDPVLPGERFSFARYPVGTSDILPQLVHEHQAGFVNRVLQLGYAARTLLHQGGGSLSNEALVKVQPLVRELVRYILFADEAPLPAGGVEGDAAFQRDFAKRSNPTRSGVSLKDFDLRTRIFRYRCSYMIYSGMIEALPPAVGKAVTTALIDALRDGSDGAHLPNDEKAAIRSILRETHQGCRDIPE